MRIQTELWPPSKKSSHPCYKSTFFTEQRHFLLMAIILSMVINHFYRLSWKKNLYLEVNLFLKHLLNNLMVNWHSFFKNAVLYLFVWLTKFDEIDPRTTSFYNCTLEREEMLGCRRHQNKLHHFQQQVFSAWYACVANRTFLIQFHGWCSRYIAIYLSRCRFHQHFLKQLLHTHIPTVQKDTDDLTVFCARKSCS